MLHMINNLVQKYQNYEDYRERQRQFKYSEMQALLAQQEPAFTGGKSAAGQ